MIEESSLRWVKKYLKDRGIGPLDMRDDLPVGIIYPTKVPIRGSARFYTKSITRRKINWLFIFPFLYK